MKLDILHVIGACALVALGGIAAILYENHIAGQESRDCRNLGGEPVRIDGAVLCFDPKALKRKP